MQNIQTDKLHVKAKLTEYLKTLAESQINFSQSNINTQNILHILDATYDAVSSLLPSNQIKEYTLIQSVFTDLGINFSSDSNLSLFQRHFLLFFILHNINLHSSKIGVLTSPLNIDIYFKNTASNNSVAKDENTQVTSYYLDLNKYLNTTENTVTDLLTYFWRLYNANTNTDEDLAVLHIKQPKEDVNHTIIVNSYRRQASKHHPDKGGDSAQFNKIKEAYMRLKKQYKFK